MQHRGQLLQSQRVGRWSICRHRIHKQRSLYTSGRWHGPYFQFQKQEIWPEEVYRQGSQERYSAFSALRCSLIAAHYEPATKRVTFILKTGKLLRMCKDRPSLLAIPSQDFHVHAIKTITIKNLALYAAFTTDGLLHLLASRQSRLQIAGRSTRICRGRYMSSCLLNLNSILVCSGTGETMLRLEDRVTGVALHF